MELTQLFNSQLLDLGPFSWSALGACMLNGALVGLERQTRGKPVGIRTAILIVSGTYLFMSMAVSLSPNTSIKLGFWDRSLLALAF